MKKLLPLLLLFSSLACKESPSKENQILLSQTSDTTDINNSISRGKSIYANHCASCHLTDGQGIPGVFPPLNNSDWLTEKREETIHAVKFGLMKLILVNGKQYDNIMPSPGLDDTQVADVLNYIFNAWDNTVTPPVTTKEVAAIEK